VLYHKNVNIIQILTYHFLKKASCSLYVML